MKIPLQPLRSLFSDENRSPKLFRSRWAIWTYAFAVCFVISAVSGYVVWAWPELDLDYYFLLKAHVGIGNAGLLLLCLLSAVHLNALYGRQARNLVLITFLFFFGMTLTDFGPAERFFVPLAILLFGTIRYLLPARKTRASALWVGVAAFCVLTVLYGTGWSIAGWSRQQRSNMAAHVHDVLGWFAPPLVLFHLFWGFPFREEPRTKRALVGLAIALVAVLGGASLNPERTVRQAVAITREEGIPEHARTDESTCGTALCHSEIFKQWQTSAHRFSATNLPYVRVAELMESERGNAGRETCRGCHEPQVPLPPVRIGHDASQIDPARVEPGVTCRGCHLIDHVKEPAWNGEYTFAPETIYLPGQDLANSHMFGIYLDFLPLEARDHRANFARPVQRDPKFCETCHRIEIPAESNGAESFVFDGPAPSWAQSGFAANGVRCNHCHLQLFKFPDPDSSERDYHARPDHRFFGMNAFLGDTVPRGDVIPARWDLFRDATRDWLNGRLEVSRFEQTFLFYTGDARSKAYRAFSGRPFLDLRYRGRREGDTAVLSVRTTNQRIGHRFPVSLLDVSEIWLEVEVADPDGTRLFASGALDAAGRVPDDARRLGARIVDKDGNEVQYHRIWVAAGMRDERFVYPGQMVEDEFRVPVNDRIGWLKVTARWHYRRYEPEFSEWVWGRGNLAPDLVIAESSAEVPLPIERTD